MGESVCVFFLTEFDFFSHAFSGETLGRQIVEIRVCACPGRDRKSDEKQVGGDTSPAPGGKRSKRGEAGLNVCVSAASESGWIITIPPNSGLHHINPSSLNSEHRHVLVLVRPSGASIWGVTLLFLMDFAKLSWGFNHFWLFINISIVGGRFCYKRVACQSLEKKYWYPTDISGGSQAKANTKRRRTDSKLTDTDSQQYAVYVSCFALRLDKSFSRDIEYPVAHFSNNRAVGTYFSYKGTGLSESIAGGSCVVTP